MKGYKHLTAEQKAEILRLYPIPTPTPTIAAMTGASPQQIRHCLKRAGVTLHKAQESACVLHLEELKQLVLREDLSMTQIAAMIGTSRHHLRDFLKRHSIPHTRFQQKGKNNPAWKGGRMLDKAGYVLIHMPEHPNADRHGYVREHRLVMERVLGRYLTKEEVVDHIDQEGDKSNNDPTNLRVYSSNAEHLAATRAGKAANWSEDGKARIRAAVIRQNNQRRSANRQASASDGQPSQLPSRQKTA